MAEVKDINKIILGAGEIYVKEFTTGEIPAHSEIETEANNVGHTSGGASIDYKPTKYDVKNSYGKIVKSFITEENITFKTGLLSWDLDRIALLSTAKISEVPAGTNPVTPKQKVLTFGASGSGALKDILVRFVHTEADGKKLRFTMIGNAGNGFAVQFNEKETVVDAEITAIEKIKGMLAKFEEEIA